MTPQHSVPGLLPHSPVSRLETWEFWGLSRRRSLRVQGSSRNNNTAGRGPGPQTRVHSSFL